MIRISYVGVDGNIPDVSPTELLPKDNYLFWIQTYEEKYGGPKTAVALFASSIRSIDRVKRDLSRSKDFERIRLKGIEIISMDVRGEGHLGGLKRRGKIKF